MQGKQHAIDGDGDSAAESGSDDTGGCRRLRIGQGSLRAGQAQSAAKRAELRNLMVEMALGGSDRRGHGSGAEQDRHGVTGRVELCHLVRCDPHRDRRHTGLVQHVHQRIERPSCDHRLIGHQQLAFSQQRQMRRSGPGASDAADRARKTLD